MTATGKEDRGWSDKKKMEGEDSLRTLDCLRGRLLAERQASRVAKEEAELMGNKLVELENKLREETKLRQKAEKKLKFLMKKFDSLKISATLEGLEQSSSSENCGLSCSSSSSTSGPKDTEESVSKSQTLHEMEENVQNTIQESSSTTKDSLDSPPDKSCHQSAPRSQDPKEYSQSCSNLEAPVVGIERNGKRESDDEEYITDDSLAIVPVSLAASPIAKTSELKIVNKSINEVLDALRHAREKIQSSVEMRRDIIRVGPT
ncbi:hypothetical protein JCGZ_16436 [Jatropha curcas]|uniref:Uncharacterized protein n=1 Tax=Jatropha curcas TaxID=180498 RepID=A0A067JYS7_JATCU|nr:uncharacterized protein LOC105642143 isoform X2 [Jatropha curcas]XP_037495253.1 uncharacterized protein LOC105642143 isoform X2 [Jatropha curcas]KDP29047.1 hypothetical protein JCGZ_16436 [Jatropha curcas]